MRSNVLDINKINDKEEILLNDNCEIRILLTEIQDPKQTYRVVFVPSGNNIKSKVSIKIVAKSPSNIDFEAIVRIAENFEDVKVDLKMEALLYNSKTHVTLKPVLEINNDSCSANHKATIAFFDKRALEYLKSRGIPISVAKSLLLKAFLK